MIDQAEVSDNTDAPSPAAAAAGDSPVEKKTSFADLGLRPEVMQAIAEMGFSEPMEVQTVTLPLVRAGRDIMVQSRTGSGKTAAFGIPFADGMVDPKQKSVQAIVLLPTRELALQVAAEIARISAQSGLSIVPVYGGAPMGRQIEQLRAGGQIVCGTPGRILDHLRRGTLHLDKVKCAVLDECDEMLSMGFQEDIEAILERTPKERQTMLFSATLPEGIQRLARRYMRQPEMVALSADFVGVHEIHHIYYSIPGGQREAELSRVLAFENPDRALIFCNTREETGRVAEFLRRQGLDAEAISSDLYSFPGGHRRGGARNRHRKPALRDQLHLPGLARVVHPSHRSHRSRRPLGSCDIADWSHRGWVVLLSQAAVQDPARGASPAVRGGIALQTRG